MKCIAHADQQKDGSFKHYVVFGNTAPWDAEDKNAVECANEKEAQKLCSILGSENSEHACDLNCAKCTNHPDCDPAPADDGAVGEVMGANDAYPNVAGFYVNLDDLPKGTKFYLRPAPCARCKDWETVYANVVLENQQKIATLTARLAAAEKDAGRWRAACEDTSLFLDAAFSESKSIKGKAIIDAAMDSALAARKKG